MSTGRRTIAIDQTQAQPDKTAVAEPLAVLDRFMAALNAGNEPALLATLRSPFRAENQEPSGQRAPSRGSMICLFAIVRSCSHPVAST
jgi:hypothetical protein